MLEKWNSRTSSGDVLYRDQLLGEIKTNMINVISDYRDLGVDNELVLIARTNTLFAGDVIPSREDWETLNYVLKELSTVKEQGQMYNHFIRDVSDSLGISDLEKIKEFIDYIQTLPPLTATIRVNMGLPPFYSIINLKDTTTDSWLHSNIDWELSSNGLNNSTENKPSATISFSPSDSEDVDKYTITIKAGSFSETITRPGTNLSDYRLTLDWLNWFSPSQLSNAKLTVEMDITDKRGNITKVNTSAVYPANVAIPQGVQNYEVELKQDDKAWKRVSNTTSQSYRHKMPRQNGNYSWRVRALDKSGQHTEWTTIGPRWLRYIPDPPAKPSPTVTTTVREATISWKPVARAEYYEVWHGGEQWAKDNTKGNNRYWSKVNAGDTLKVTHQKMNAGTSYTWNVRAVNEGGSNKGSVNATQKSWVTRTKTYLPTGTNVWRGGYNRIYKNWKTSWFGAQWRYGNSNKQNNIYQGAWQDADWGGWKARSDGAYWAYGGQKWGNNASYIYYDHAAMRADLRSKEIKSVTITLTRTNSVHGWSTGKPLYLYNHKKDSWNNTGSIGMFRANGEEVAYGNQEYVQYIKFERGQKEVIVNNNTKQLIQNIVDGKMKGLGIVFYYGSDFNADPPVAAVNYMYFNGSPKIDVEYWDME